MLVVTWSHHGEQQHTLAYCIRAPCSAGCHPLLRMVVTRPLTAASIMACCTFFHLQMHCLYSTGIAKVFAPIQVLLRKDIEQLMNSKAQKVK